MMAGEDNSYNEGRKKRKIGRKDMKAHAGFDSKQLTQKSSKHQEVSLQQTSFIRKPVDPETAKYFSEIANAIEGSEIDLEERSVICGNALEEAKGKEVELATDYFISHTMQTLLEGCSVDCLCGFLRSCAKNFPQIAMDRSGSHVAETALKSLAVHLQDSETHTLIEETITTICKTIAGNPVDIMCNCYGSHVLRSLLCLCRGVPLDSSEFHATKSSIVLAERLNINKSQLNDNELQHLHVSFPGILKFLVSGILETSRKDMATLQVNQYSSLVLQTALKLLAGQEQLLLHIIPVLLGSGMENAVEGDPIKMETVKNLLSLMEKTAFSHLMEVILEVASETVYNELFMKIFRNSLFVLSSHQCGNFVVQALVSQARTQVQMELIWEELGSKLKDLLEMGRSGVVASLVAACQRLHSHENKCCQALAAAVSGMNEPSTCLIPRILFLDNYFLCEDKSSWNWPNDVKMHVVGSLILQTIFKLPCEFIHTYITSITSLEESYILQTSKDPSGSRVIEAFLCSNASAKQKRKLVLKLCGHFGELSVHPSGSFTIEKCFNACNVSLRETIVSELLPMQADLSKTKQGPYLLRKLDIDGFAKQPDQWKLRQASKQSAYKEFYAAFGPSETKVTEKRSFLAEADRKSQTEKLKDIRKEIDGRLSRVAPTSGSQFLAHQGSKTKSKKSGLKRPRERGNFDEAALNGNDLKDKNKKEKKRKG